MKIKYFDKGSLALANLISMDRNYNRQLNPEFVNKLEKGLKFPVVFSMLHEHIGGKIADPHIRAIVAYSEDDTLQIDVDMDLFKSLPEVEVQQ